MCVCALSTPMLGHLPTRGAPGTAPPVHTFAFHTMIKYADSSQFAGWSKLAYKQQYKASGGWMDVFLHKMKAVFFLSNKWQPFQSVHFVLFQARAWRMEESSRVDWVFEYLYGVETLNERDGTVDPSWQNSESSKQRHLDGAGLGASHPYRGDRSQI